MRWGRVAACALAGLGIFSLLAAWVLEAQPAQTWEAPPVLISMATSQPDPMFPSGWIELPRLVVYADGTVISAQSWYDGDIQHPAVEVAQLGSAELCSLLRRIEGYGFLDFDPTTYGEPQVSDSGSTLITINAWQTQRVEAYALEFALNNPDFIDPLDVPLPLANTYKLLSTYHPPGSTPYQPERITILVDIIPEGRSSGIAATRWPFNSPSLADLANDGTEQGPAEYLLEGEQAAELYSLLAEQKLEIFIEDTMLYHVAIRPLLPLEIWEKEETWRLEPTFETTPTRTLTCPAE